MYTVEKHTDTVSLEMALLDRALGFILDKC